MNLHRILLWLFLVSLGFAPQVCEAQCRLFRSRCGIFPGIRQGRCADDGNTMRRFFFRANREERSNADCLPLCQETTAANYGIGYWPVERAITSYCPCKLVFTALGVNYYTVKVCNAANPPCDEGIVGFNAGNLQDCTCVLNPANGSYRCSILDFYQNQADFAFSPTSTPSKPDRLAFRKYLNYTWAEVSLTTVTAYNTTSFSKSEFIVKHMVSANVTHYYKVIDVEFQLQNGPMTHVSFAVPVNPYSTGYPPQTDHQASAYDSTYQTLTFSKDGLTRIVKALQHL
jgi:hypothetical protein